MLMLMLVVVVVVVMANDKEYIVTKTSVVVELIITTFQDAHDIHSHGGCRIRGILRCDWCFSCASVKSYTT